MNPDGIAIGIDTPFRHIMGAVSRELLIVSILGFLAAAFYYMLHSMGKVPRKHVKKHRKKRKAP